MSELGDEGVWPYAVITAQGSACFMASMKGIKYISLSARGLMMLS